MPHPTPISDALWQDAWPQLAPGDGLALQQQLRAAYAEPHRHYHTLQHLEEACRLLQPQLALARLAASSDEPFAAAELVMALWFHDAVYLPGLPDNEAASAAWAASALRQAGVAAEHVRRITGLIGATARHQATDPAQALLLDVDLAILGAGPARFAEYERQIRAEYAAFPEADYRAGRRAVLEEFLARPWIYQTPAFRQQFEAAARRNLSLALAAD